MSTRVISATATAPVSGAVRSEYAGPATAWALGTATLLTMLPVTLLVPVLKELLADRFSASTFWTHSFMSVNMIGAIAVLPLFASVADRTGSRRRLIGMALLLEALLFLAMSRAPSLAVILGLRALEGAAHMLALSTLMAVAADAAAPSARGRMMGVIGCCMMLGTALGTRLGGIVWRSAPGWTFEVAAGIAGAAALAAMLTVPRTTRSTAPGTLRDAVSLFRRHRELFIPGVYTFIDRFCVGLVISTFVLFLGTCHGVDPEGRSRLLAMFLVPFALLVYPAGRLVDRIGGTIPLVFGSGMFGLLFACYGFIPMRLLPVAMVASGVLSAMMFAPTLSLCADLAPPGRRGAAFAGFNAAGSLGFICGPLIGGAICQALADSIGTTGAYQAAFVVAGMAEVVCALVTVRWILKLQRRGSMHSIRSGDVVAHN